jgi:hypothetical protein
MAAKMDLITVVLFTALWIYLNLGL